MKDPTRRTAAAAASLALHAAVLASLLGRGLVHLDLVPAPILVTLLPTSSVIAGAGETSPRLQVASPAAAAKPVEVTPPDPALPRAVEDAVRDPVVVPSPHHKPFARSASPRAVPSSSVPPSADAGSSSGAAASADAATGSSPRASAPAWAPSARISYEALLFAWMNRHKEYPMLAQRRGLQGSGAVRVRIDRAGRVLERTVDRSTGEAMLDQAALDMVAHSSPFPSVPDAWAGASFEFVAPIEYRLR